MGRPIVALLSDFGTRDHYAGVMKGVILGICPDVTLVDLSHDLPAHDIPFAAQELAATYKYFPAGTIFLVVVDPGVGTTRRGLAAEAGDWKFVAPDNGVLSAVFGEVPPKRVVELTERRFARPTVSRTFEGRDRFAPAAAWLAKGTIQLAAFGRTVTDYRLIDLPRATLEDGVLRGSVVRVDRFGNVVTSLDRPSCERLADGRGVQLTVGGRSIPRLVSTYSDIAPGEIGALFGSTDHLECAAHAASAADALGVGVGDPVELRRT
jgi:S-adenosylmethionine hydrolase